jgi:hypothetical protein
MILTVLQAEYIGDHRILVSFSDGAKSLVNLADYLDGEVFEPLKDVDFFKSFVVTGNTVEWPNGADIAPEFLREIGQEVRGAQCGDYKRAANGSPHIMVAEGKTEYQVGGQDSGSEAIRTDK